jgi:allantoinase
MPLNSIPPTTSVAALEEKRAAATGHCRVDVGFLGGVVPGNTAQLAGLHWAGVVGFKCFLSPSGVDEFPSVSRADLEVALPRLAELNALLMVHAELPTRLAQPQGDPTRYRSWLNTRPAEAEVEAVGMLVELSQRYGVRVHVVHVSAPRTVEVIRQARQRGVRITGETCPHYLRFAAEEIPDGAVEFKCAPPIRDAASREGLWAALEQGGLDLVVSDHSPAPPEVKEPQPGDFLRAWGGIASLQLRLPLMWTMARIRGHQPERLVEWLCTAPARLVGLEQRKGALAPGHDADLVLWHPERVFTVTPGMLKHRHSMMPWLGHRLAGEVEATYLRGECVFSLTGPARPPSGRLLSRSD